MNQQTAMAVMAVLFLAAAPQLLHAGAAPQSAPKSSGPNSGASVSRQSFAPSCLSNALTDIRPDPAWVRASYEHDNCRAPEMPALPDGASAKRETILAAMATVKRYGAQSDDFQKCVTDYLARRRAIAARAGQTIPVWVTILENHRLLASQKNKEQGAARMRSTIEAFNAYGSECEDHG
jgi:hypothetical protein